VPLHYLIDGYNIIKKTPGVFSANLQSGREELIRLIEIHAPQGSLNNPVTIVFDGRSGVFGGMMPSFPGGLKVIFSQDESADDKIRKIVEKSDRKKEMVVVTDDRELGFATRAMGTKLMSVKEFLGKTEKPSPQFKRSISKDKKEIDEKSISQSLEYQITDEMKKIWLKEK